jgi:hypothetical protein
MRAVQGDAVRPRPLLSALKSGAWKPAVAGVVSMLVAVGILNADQSTALQGLLVAVDALVTAGAGVWAAFHVVRQGEPLVTPMSDPRAEDMTPLHPIPGGGVVDLTNRPPGPDSPLR